MLLQTPSLLIPTMILQPPALAFLYNIQGGQLLLIIFVALILFGGNRFPELARSIGKAVHGFRRAATHLSQDAPPPPTAKRAPDSVMAEAPASKPESQSCTACSCQDKA